MDVISFLLVLHLFLCLALIIAVLLHRGEGMGLSSVLMGGSTFLGSTLIEKYLDRITIVLSIAWGVTTLLLVLYWR
jgi:preprotein translocase subunit SecG